MTGAGVETVLAKMANNPLRSQSGMTFSASMTRAGQSRILQFARAWKYDVQWSVR